MKAGHILALLLGVLALGTCVPQPKEGYSPREEKFSPGVAPSYRSYATPAPLGTRSLMDRVDDAQRLYQIHVLYVTLSDSLDYKRDLDGEISRAIQETNDWLAQQTGGSRLRFDTYQGELDITYVQLPMTNQEFQNQTVESFGSAENIRQYLETTLDRMGILGAGKLYLAVFEIGEHPTTCADSAHPPDVMGRLAGLYPSALLDRGYYCGTEQLGNGPSAADFGAIHEIMHLLGFASACGKNPASAGNISHTGDDNRDLMWGSTPYDTRTWDTENMLLDPGNDDYYNIDDPNCPDLARSAFLDPLPVNAQLPPGWPDEWKLHR